MVMKMMLAGKLVGVTEIEPREIKTKGYLQCIQDVLRQKYKGALSRCGKQPTFLLEIPADNG
jgi:hypothetical protein